MIYEVICKEIVPGIWGCGCDLGNGHLISTTIHTHSVSKMMELARRRLCNQRVACSHKGFAWVAGRDRLKCVIMRDGNRKEPILNLEKEPAIWELIEKDGAFACKKHNRPLLTESEVKKLIFGKKEGEVA